MRNTLAVVLLLSGVVSGALAQPPSIVTYAVPDAVASCPYSVTIDGASVPMEKAGDLQGAYYTRFELKPGAKVRARVAVAASVPTTFALKPERYRTNVGSRPSPLEFDIDTPGPRVITAICGTRELWPLIILVDPEKKAAEPSGKVYKLAPGDSIQKTLDECAANGGGTVLFGPGVYVTGSIFIRDNTNAVLSPGTLIKGSPDPKDYPAKSEADSNAPGGRACALINFDHAKNSSISGPGVIDGTGQIIRNQFGKHIRAMLVLNSENIEIKDIVLRNSASWTCHVFGSKEVRIDRLKVLADWSLGNTDGIDPDCSRDVSISNYFCFNGDDGVAMKATTKAGPSSDITVKNAVVMTHKTAFKIGTETLRDISNVLIEDCEAVNTGRGLGLYLQDGATVSNITYRNIKLDIIEYPNERYGGSPFSASIGTRTEVGKMDGITFENVTAQAPWYSDFTGQPESYISNITFRNCSLAVTNRSIKTEKLPVFSLKYCRGFRWVNSTLEWRTPMACLWDGVVKTESSESIDTSGLTETTP